MNLKKIAIASVAGGIVFWLLGGLIYGMALTSFMTEHAAGPTANMRGDADMILWAMLLGNIIQAGLFAYIYDHWAGIATFMSGAKAGLLIGALMAAGMGFINYAVFSGADLTWVITDIVVHGVMGAIAGGVIGFLLGKVS